MRLGDDVKVTCTDTGKSQTAVVHKMGKDYLEVLVGPETKKSRIIMRKKSGSRLYVGTTLGMEFTVET